MVWVYDRNLRTHKRLHPKSVCFATDLYAVRPDGSPRDRRIETDILGPVEGAAAPVIRKIAPGVTLTDDEVEVFAFFIGLQSTRIPSFAGAVAKTFEATHDRMMRTQFATVERATNFVERYEQETGDTSLDPEEIVDIIMNKKVTFRATERPFLNQMFTQAKALASLIESSGWTFLTAPINSGFITCDNPFTVVPPNGMKFEGIGIGPGLPGVTSYFPVNERYCLRLDQNGFKISFENINAQEVRVVNMNIAANSDRFVLASNQKQLEAVIARSKSAELEKQERVVVEVLEANENESLIKFMVLPRRYFYAGVNG